MLAGVAAPAGAQTVTDGDTLKFDRQLVRLYGIDAQERRQPCDDGNWWPGPMATQALINFIGGRPVTCHQVDYDRRNKRPVSLCYAGGQDLQAMMVGAGWAWAFTKYSAQYQDAERRAAARGVGVHAHGCEKPWEWRAKNRR